MKIIRLFLLSFTLVVLSCCANAQTADVLASCASITIDAGGRHVLTMDTTGKLCANVTVSATASIAAFAPVGTNNAISVTSTTARTALTGAAANSTTLVENSGATDVFVAFGDNTVTVTAANGTRVPAGWGIAFNIGTATNIAYITASSTSTISATTGTGLPALGAAGSGGAGGSVTQGTSPWVTAPGLTTSTLSAWSSATGGGVTQAIMSSGGWPAITVQLNQTSTISGGAVTFEGTYDGSTWVTIPVAQILNPNTLANLTNPYTLVQSTNQPFLILTQGYQQVRIRLSTVITGSGTVTPFVALLPFNPTLSALLNPLVGPFLPLVASEAHIGEIGSNQIKVQVAQTVTAASAYTSGNAIGGKMTIAGAARVSGSLGAAGTGGILTGMQMNSKSLQTTQVDVFLFDADPSGSTCTDKTAFVLATADFDKVVGILTIPGTAANGAGWFGGGTGSVGIPSYLPVTYDLSSATSLFACAVTRGTPTFTATTDVSFKYNLLRN